VATLTRDHWEEIYRQKAPDQVSWYEAMPRASLELIEDAAVARDAAILDLGGGASGLAGRLLEAGYADITVADISAAALERARSALGERATRIKWVQADVRDHDFGRTFDVWHDRAVLHFMVDPDDRDRYLDTLRGTLDATGHLIVAMFGPEGPTRCSGLPVSRYSEPEIRELLPDFELVSSRLQVHHTPAGTPQQFLYAHLRRAPAR
jgi:2-polyprenyl-3-methyl-5-hydroxy-6-metoxy-1,4-benzoquinol methylase